MKLEDRFWSKVNIGEEDECWEWAACLNNYGYGQIHIGRKTHLAHRTAWEITYGKVPEGQGVCHTCDNPSCCNPSHLFLGTQADNSADMVAKNRSACGEQHSQAKLTEVDVLEIRRLWEETDLYQRKIAEMFGVAHSTISIIVNRKTWTWL